MEQALTERLGLTAEELKELQRAAVDTWDVIGGDVLQAMEDSGEARKGRAVMPRADVIEVVLDADYILTNNPRLSESVRRLLLSHDPDKYDAKQEALEEAFPCARYGW